MKKRLVCSFAVFSMLYALCAMQVFPAVPGKLNYQGKLTDNQGDLITGTKEIDFALFTDAASSFAVWTESHVGVQVTNGLFNVVLGTANDLSSSFENYDSLYLEIGVEGETLSPRQEMASAGYALKAQSTYQDASYPMETYVVKAGGTPGVDCDFTTVSDALGSNRSIFIKNGTYAENLNLIDLSNLIMRGESYYTVVCNSGADDAITLDGCTDVLLEQLTIEIMNTGYSAINFSESAGVSDNVTIRDCLIENNSGGTASGISSENAEISVTNNRLISNTASTGYGIKGTFNASLFQGNRMINWATGFCFVDSYRGNIASSNHIESSGGVGTAGFCLQTCSASSSQSRCQIVDNYISGPETGIEMVYSRENTVSGNKIRGALLYGIYASDASTSLVSNNDIVMNTSYSGAGCIYMEGNRSWESAIVGNNLNMWATGTNSAYAIYFDANNGCIQGNYAATVTGDNTVGIYIPPARGSCLIVGNNNRNWFGNALYAPNWNIVDANWNNDTS